MASHPVRHPGSTNQLYFDRAVDALQADFSSAAAHMAIDGQTRAAYDRLIRRFSAETRAAAEQGRLTWEEAATQANSIRNTVMAQLRWRSTPVGRALAERIKAEGKTLNELIARYTVKHFGERADFNRLGAAERNVVYREVVEAAGRSSRYWTPLMRTVSVAGRAMLVVSLAIAVYDIANAKDHVAEAKHQGALFGAGIAGGAAGGALAGLVCGPGAPICVTIGAFAGGAAAAFGVDLFVFHK